MQCGTPLLDEFLGENENNDFFKFQPDPEETLPDPFNFEKIEDWDFTMGRSPSDRISLQNEPMEIQPEPEQYSSPTEAGILNLIKKFFIGFEHVDRDFP